MRRKLGCPEGRSAATWVDYSLFGHQIVCHHVKGYSAAASRNAGAWCLPACLKNNNKLDVLLVASSDREQQGEPKIYVLPSTARLSSWLQQTTSDAA